MKLAIMQPTFNPWIGYFDLIDYCDTFIFLDTVQLSKRSWQTRNKLKINNSEFMFTIPIKKQTSRSEIVLKDIEISYNHVDFKKKLYELLIRNYKKAEFFDSIIKVLKPIILYQTTKLSKYNINFIVSISKLLDMDTNFIKASDLQNIKGSKGELIYNISSSLSTTSYISPLGSKEYLEDYKEQFNKNNIKIVYQYYSHPSYNQVGKKFIPYLGILDLLLNQGIDNTKKIISNGRNFK